MTVQNKKYGRKAQEKQGPVLIAWHVSDKGEKSFWTRIGAAWEHEDGKGLNLTLDLLPPNGRVVLRAPSEETETEKGA